MEEKEIYRKAIELFGIESQKAVAIEECAELIQAICHTSRNRTKYSIAEETADVEIMCGQLREIVGDNIVQEWKAKKLSRLKELIEKARMEEMEEKGA